MPSPLVFRSAKMEAVPPDCPEAQNHQNQQQPAEYQIGLPKPGQPVVPEVVHMVGRLIQRGRPTDPNPGLIGQFIRQPEQVFQVLRIQQKTGHAESENRDDSRHRCV